MILQSFLWTIVLAITGAVVRILRGEDGSFTYFLFTGINFVVNIAEIGCLFWFLFAVGCWVWAHLW